MTPLEIIKDIDYRYRFGTTLYATIIIRVGCTVYNVWREHIVIDSKNGNRMEIPIKSEKVCPLRFSMGRYGSETILAMKSDGGLEIGINWSDIDQIEIRDVVVRNDYITSGVKFRWKEMYRRDGYRD